MEEILAVLSERREISTVGDRLSSSEFAWHHLICHSQRVRRLYCSVIQRRRDRLVGSKTKISGATLNRPVVLSDC
jgi:hypothetical protein